MAAVLDKDCPGTEKKQVPGPEKHPGTYVLIFLNTRNFWAQVGQLGRVEIPPGHYLYVGSAFGPGGLKSRVARHARKKKVHRWHIDYLRPHFDLESVWFTYAPAKLECSWVQSLPDIGGRCLVPRFGASDCSCESHLFFFDKKPEIADFSAHIAEESLAESLMGSGHFL